LYSNPLKNGTANYRILPAEKRKHTTSLHIGIERNCAYLAAPLLTTIPVELKVVSSTPEEVYLHNAISKSFPL